MARLRGRTDLLNPTTSATLSVGETAPTNPVVGQRWFRLSTSVIYQYTSDGTSNFWLDISSAGIGTSAERGVEFVGDIDPHKATNLGVVGSVYYNRENNRHFVCTTATSNSQVWSGKYSGLGGTETDYLLSSTYYRVHSFLKSDTFSVQSTITCDILIVGGGGGGGAYSGAGAGAGGVRQLTSQSLIQGVYNVTVGASGSPSRINNSDAPKLYHTASNGGDSSVIGGSYSEIASGGGWGGSFEQDGTTGTWLGATGGCGGGGGALQGNGSHAGKAGNTPSKSPSQGFGGGEGSHSSGSYVHSGGGGGAGGAGSPNGTGGAGGVGISNYYRTGSAGTTATVHRFAGGGAGDGNAGNGASQAAYGGGAAGGGVGGAGIANSGGGGGGGNYSNNSHGGAGGTGIVVIRYPLN